MLLATKAHWLLVTANLLRDEPLVLCDEFERCTDVSQPHLRLEISDVI